MSTIENNSGKQLLLSAGYKKNGGRGLRRAPLPFLMLSVFYDYTPVPITRIYFSRSTGFLSKTFHPVNMAEMIPFFSFTSVTMAAAMWVNMSRSST